MIFFMISLKLYLLQTLQFFMFELDKSSSTITLNDNELTIMTSNENLFSLIKWFNKNKTQ